jgi:hypothetical protein
VLEVEGVVEIMIMVQEYLGVLAEEDLAEPKLYLLLEAKLILALVAVVKECQSLSQTQAALASSSSVTKSHHNNFIKEAKICHILQKSLTVSL